jgi:uncharacterized protein
MDMFGVCHFEIPADDVERAQKFYRELFGWKIEKLAGASPDYWLVTTGTEAGGMTPLGGGMMLRQAPQQQITIYIEVPSVTEYVDKVQKLGGRVCFPKTAVPEFGYFAVCLDPENNGFGIWEFNANAK